MIDRLLDLVTVLRRQGIPVTAGDVIDASRALEVLDLTDRATLRSGLRAVLVTRETELAVFDRAFDVVFAAVDVPQAVAAESAPAAPVSTAGDAGATGLAADVAVAAASGDTEAMTALAARAVALFADDALSDRQVLYRIMRAVDLANLLGAVLRQARVEGQLSDFELSLRRHEVAAALEAFRRALAAELLKVRDRRAIARGDDASPPSLAVEQPLASLTAGELRELRRLLYPLARQLAARVGRRRRPRETGRVDMRRTMRSSLQSGGTPIDPVLRRRHPHRPDVVVLCDLSGSVAEFAQFTISLVHAIHDVLAGVRSFAFVGGVNETTELFAVATYDVPVLRLLERPGVVGLDGHSDYGAVFREFAAEHLDAIDRRTTLIVTGDARSNFRDSGRDAFATIAAAARRVYWLDPEPRADWYTDDSALADYAPLCDGVFEVSSVRTLADVIAELV
jgi:uncharacterized protein with von Willebrand factor type A (vWA) domain